MRLSALSLLMAGLSLPVMAQTPTDLDAELAALLNTPVQGASKREQRLLDSPQAIEVLTGDEIRQMGIYRLADALRLMTSVDVLEMDTQATYVTIRGAMQQGSPRTVQFLIDGVPLYNGEAGSVDVDNIPVPVDLIDKVEVVRGPSSSLYGANAVVGVISITTRRPTEGTTGGLRISRANLGTTRGAADISTGTSNLGLTAGYSGASLGVDREATMDLGTGARSVLDQNSAHQYSAFARGHYDFSANSQIWASAGEAKKDFGYSSAYTDIPYAGATTRTLQAGWAQTWSPVFRTEARISRMEQQLMYGPSSSFLALFSDPGFTSNYTWIDFTSTLLEVQANWDPSSSFHVVAGADHRASTAGKAPFIGLPKSQDVTAAGGFLNIDWNLIPALSLNLGARAENETLGGSRIAPRASLVWNPQPSSSFRVGYYSSTRSPQILEKYNSLSASLGYIAPGVHGQLDFAPNPQLAPEKVTSIEVGYRQQISKVTLDVTAFKMKFTDLIASTNTTGIDPTVVPFPTMVIKQQYLNSGSSNDQGLEVAAKWLVVSNFSVGGNYTLLDYTLDSTGQQLDYAPKSKVNLWTRYNHGAFSAYAAYQHVDSVLLSIPATTVATSLETSRPAVDQIHLNLGWQFSNGVALGAYVHNANKGLVPQGGTGVMPTNLLQGSRREVGGTLSYRF